jgi:hypothetical protein
MPFFSSQMKDSASKTTVTLDDNPAAVTLTETYDRASGKEEKSRLFFATEEETFAVAKTESVSNKNEEIELVKSCEAAGTPSENVLPTPQSDPSEAAPPQAILISIPSEASPPQFTIATSPLELPAESVKEKENPSSDQDSTDISREEKSSENLTRSTGEEVSPEIMLPAELGDLNDKPQDSDEVLKTVSEGEADSESIDHLEPISAQVQESVLNVKSNNEVAEVEPHELKRDGIPIVSDEAIEKENSVSDSCVTL